MKNYKTARIYEVAFASKDKRRVGASDVRIRTGDDIRHNIRVGIRIIESVNDHDRNSILLLSTPSSPIIYVYSDKELVLSLHNCVFVGMGGRGMVSGQTVTWYYYRCSSLIYGDCGDSEVDSECWIWKDTIENKTGIDMTDRIAKSGEGI